jgi:hypothetical protein
MKRISKEIKRNIIMNSETSLIWRAGVAFLKKIHGNWRLSRLFNNQFEKKLLKKLFFLAGRIRWIFFYGVITTKRVYKERTLLLCPLHVGFASLKTETTTFYSVTEKINFQLQIFSMPTLIQPSTEKREKEHDTNHDGVIVWKLWNIILW